MKGRGWAIVLAVGVAARCLGLLPQSRALEGLRLVGTLAVDGGDGVTATAVTAVRAAEGEEPETFTGRGADLAAACGALRQASSRRAYLGQTEKLLLGEGADLAATLNYVLSDRELRLDTLLYIVRGEAGSGLTASLDRAPAEVGGRDPRGVTVGQALTRLSQGEPAALPALAADGEGKLAPAGWAVVTSDGVAGWLEGEGALGCELLHGVESQRVIPLPGGSVRLTGARIWAAQGVLHCYLAGEVTGGSPSGEELAAWGEGALRAALAPGWDCWGLEGEQRALQPWGEVRPVGELKLRVTGKVERQDDI